MPSSYSRGYRRAVHTGEVLSIQRVMTNSRVDRFWSRVDRRGENECWLWTGGNLGSSGYALMQGCVDYAKYSFGVHRIAYMLGHGCEAVGVVLHRCDVPLCCNPAHLRDGSYIDNMDDARLRGRRGAVGRRFTKEERTSAVERYRFGETQASIARDLGIPSRHVQAWCSSAGLSVVRGPYAARRQMPAPPSEERAVQTAWRRLDRAEDGRFTRSIEAEPAEACSTGGSASAGPAGAVGSASEDRAGAEHG
jgi:transposase-like protein